MEDLAEGVKILLAESETVSIVPVLDALGERHFDTKLIAYLHQFGGVEHYTAYRFESRTTLIGGASVRGAHAKEFPRVAKNMLRRTFSDIARARDITSSCNWQVLHPDLWDTDDVILRDAFRSYHIVDRVLLCGRRASGWYAVSLLRSSDSGPFNDHQLEDLAESANIVISAVAKQSSLSGTPRCVADSFASVEVIEETLMRSGLGISKRELQVCARLLYGISAFGISKDLGLTEDTVMTYRKRSYQRLHISCRHELFQLYLGLISAYDHRATGAEPAT